MTSRERILTALSHKETDIVPFAWGFGINYPAKKALAEYMNKDMTELGKILGTFSDICEVVPKYIGPDDRNKRFPDGSYVDKWGVTRSPVQNAIFC